MTMLQPGQPAPDFAAEALVGNEFKQVTLAEYKGKYLLLFFYPADLYVPPLRSSPLPSLRFPSLQPAQSHSPPITVSQRDCSQSHNQNYCCSSL